MFSMLLPLVHQSHISVTCHSHDIPSAMDLGVSGNALSNLQPCGHSAVETCDGTRMCLQSTELK
jgi:hypothetical protein